MDLPFDLGAEVVKLIDTKSIELPTYPGVALKLQRLISSGNYGMPDLAKAVESDQALATAVMRTANSAFYGASKPITTLQLAIARVGANSLNNIAIAGTLGAQSSSEGPLVSLRKVSWRRSLISALLCQHLAPRRKVNAGEAFLAGLLHDFGETIAYACFEALLESHPGTLPQDADSWSKEARRFHTQLGTILATEWKLPPYVEATVQHHHTPQHATAEFSPMVQLVELVDVLVGRLEDAPSVGQVSLEDLPGVQRAEFEGLREVMLKVPAFLESFEDTSGPRAKAKPSLVAPAPSSLTPEAPTVDFEIIVTTRNDRRVYSATQMSADALRMRGTAAQTERQLIHLELKPGVKACATVMSCVAVEGKFAIEVKPFALNEPARAEWNRLLAGIALAPAA
ncbi:MAG: HDOD domain-containing protein [Archangium sp.]|nr:HDOD domain-containing protein [Archangium sp.]MDP3574274.1 HDOD domain-containing protein [Archangium sp.]